MAFKKIRQAENKEKNNRIANMDLTELKKYLCMKNGQNPEKCDGCLSLKGCPAGQRAMVLLNERNARENAEPLNGTATVGNMEEFRMAKGQRVRTSDEIRRTFTAAVQAEEMDEWLMELDGITKNAAQIKLKTWAAICSDIAEKYKFHEKYEALKKRRLSDARKGARSGNPWNDAQREKSLAEYRETMAQDDPAGYYAEKYGVTRTAALGKICHWKHKYGTIEKEKAPMTQADEKNDSDVSIEEFLNEYNPAEEETGGTRTEEVPVREDGSDIKMDPVPTETEQPAATMPCGGLKESLKAKAEQLEAERETLDEEIDRLRERCAWIEKALEALATTMNLFNPDSAIGKDF